MAIHFKLWFIIIIETSSIKLKHFLDARQVSIVKTFSFHNMYILNNIHIVIAESLDNAHLASRNPENASASGGKPPDPQDYY